MINIVKVYRADVNADASVTWEVLRSTKMPNLRDALHSYETFCELYLDDDNEFYRVVLLSKNGDLV